MIQYERERKDKRSNSKDSAGNRWKDNEGHMKDATEDNNENNNVDYETQIKKTEKFIKKLERANKEEDINKAVDILTMGQKRSESLATSKSIGNGSNKILSDNEVQGSRASSRSAQEETLINIEETIKFMEEKLFNPNYKKNKNNGQNSQTAEVSATTIENAENHLRRPNAVKSPKAVNPTNQDEQSFNASQN
jgi:hypothetical protein